MAKRAEKTVPHPDDFMVVTVALEFQAKLNPAVVDPPSFETVSVELILRAAEAADYIEKVLNAIRDKRLYGFMVQEMAESAVGAGDWIRKTRPDVLAEAIADRGSGNSDPTSRQSENRTEDE
jgi:hypothetical protein